MRPFFPAVLIMALLSPFGAAAAPLTRLDDAAIRGFIAEQGRAWNARDFDRFYATLAPDAAIVLVTTQAGEEVARRVRTPAQDRRQAEQFFASAHAKIQETDRIEKIAIAPDGRHARVRVKETARIRGHGRTKLVHSVAEQELELRSGRIVAVRLMEFESQ